MTTVLASQATLDSDAFGTVLTVCRQEQDHLWLLEILRGAGALWKVNTVRTCEAAASVLRKRDRIFVVVCDSDLPDGDWKNLLEETAGSPGRPLLIVSSFHADDRLWAEVLSLGGYDLLLKPLDPEEARRVLGLAWRHWRFRADERSVSEET